MKTPTQKTFIRLALALIALQIPTIARARLGETGEEITKRFGDEVQVHPSYANSSMAIDELGRALYFSIGAETQKIMDVLNSWSWDRVTFRGYRFGEFNVYVILLDNKSVFEHYSRGATLNEQEMDKLLASNSGGNKWQKIVRGPDADSSIRIWKITEPNTKKLGRMAITNGGSNLSFYVPDIVIYCVNAATSIAEKSEKKRTEGLKGF